MQFVDRTPLQVYAVLLARSEYLCSVSTMYERSTTPCAAAVPSFECFVALRFGRVACRGVTVQLGIQSVAIRQLGRRPPLEDMSLGHDDDEIG